MLEVWAEEPEGLINQPYLQEQRHRQRAHTLSARGDNQRGAIGQPTRWSALYLVHSDWIAYAQGLPEGVIAGNVQQQLVQRLM